MSRDFYLCYFSYLCYYYYSFTSCSISWWV